MEVHYAKITDGGMIAGITAMGCSQCQNYHPLLSRFFALTVKNWNSVTFLSHNTVSAIRKVGGSCEVDVYANQERHTRKAFVKFCPLLDPVHFLVGKYDRLELDAMRLPSLNGPDTHPKLDNPNNSAYVDAFASYLCGELAHRFGYPHAPAYFGTATAKKDEFRFSIGEDTRYVMDTDFFAREEGTLFTADIGERSNVDQTRKAGRRLVLGDVIACDPSTWPANADSYEGRTAEATSIGSRSSSFCSSRSSNTRSTDGQSDNESVSSETYGDSVTIRDYPVQVVITERCEGTLDELLLHDSLEAEEIASALLQIVMALAGIQRAFGMVHNDLHTNNVMYTTTDRQYLYYKFNGRFFRVPTHGRVYKIIDFGRATYTYKARLICSDSFDAKGDAATQYNTEPYFDAQRRRVDPNMSFDLCRLACSMCDFPLAGCSELRGLVDRWCSDDKGRNIMYKSNGQERYPDFKLYKMIARTVHDHTPDAASESPEFAKFVVHKKKANGKQCFNIDRIPVLISSDPPESEGRVASESV